MRLLPRHHEARCAYEQPQLKLGEEIESFEIGRRLIAQKSKILNPILTSSIYHETWHQSTQYKKEVQIVL